MKAAVLLGMLLLNGATVLKPGAQLRAGDLVVVKDLPEPPPLQVRLCGVSPSQLLGDHHLEGLVKSAAQAGVTVGLRLTLSALHAGDTGANTSVHCVRG